MSRPTIRTLRAAILPGVAILLSCTTTDSPLAADRYEGVFVLASVDGDSLPADAPNDTDAGVGLVTAIHADTLVFLPAGLGHWTNVWRRRFAESGVVVDSSYRRTPFRYVREGDAMRITFMLCQPECRDFFSDTARVESGDALDRFRQATWRYTRIAVPSP